MGLIVAPGTATVVQGLAGSGKTTLLRQLLAAHADAGATVFVQDPDHQFADLFPVYETAADYRRAARDAGDGPFPRGAAVAEVDGELVTDLALAAAPIAKAEGRYTVLAYDEAVLAADPNYVGPKQRDLLARRRHRAVSVIINSQDFGQIHAMWQRLATEMYAFWCVDTDRVKAIAKKWGRDPDRLARQLAALGPHEWARIENRRPSAVAA